MPLPQDISPLNSELMDTLIRAGDQQWIETEADQAWIKILYLGEETGSWAAIFKWRQGYVAPPHKHLAGSHTYMLKGEVQVRDELIKAGDYIYEPNGMLHGATTALSDTEYLFISMGPVLFFDEDHFAGYLGWEELARMQQAAAAASNR